jgi:hypothetical protein
MPAQLLGDGSAPCQATLERVSRPKAFERAEKRLGLTLPDSYVDTVTGKKVFTGSGRWEFLLPDKLGRLDETYGIRRRGVVIAHDVGGDALVLLVDRKDPRRAGEAVYQLDHETGKLKRIASSVRAMFSRSGPRFSLARAEREAGPRSRPAKDPPSAASERIASLLDGSSIEKARGDSRDYVRLIYTAGAVSDEYAAWKLHLAPARLREVIEDVLARLESEVSAARPG